MTNRLRALAGATAISTVLCAVPPLAAQTLLGPTTLGRGVFATYSFDPGPPPGSGYSPWAFGWSSAAPYGSLQPICTGFGGEPALPTCLLGSGVSGPMLVEATAQACKLNDAGTFCIPGSLVERKGTLNVDVTGSPILSEFYGVGTAVYQPPATLALFTTLYPSPGSPNDGGWPGPPQYSWSFGDGRTSGEAAPTVTFAQAGVYQISLRLSNASGSSATVTRELMVGRTCCADFGFSPSAPRVNEEVQFTDASTGDPISYEWSFGDGATSTERNPRHTYTRIATFSVSVIEHYLGGFQNLKSKSISVGPPLPPVADFDYSPLNPQVGDTIRFRDLSTGSPTSWFWTILPSGSTTQAQNPAYTCTVPETVRVTLTCANAGGASQPVTKEIVIGAGSGQVADFSWSPQVGAVGQEIRFSDRSTPTPLSYFWQFGDGGTSTERSPTHTYQQPGPPPRSEYLVSLRVEYPGGVVKTAGLGVPVLGSSAPTAEFTFTPGQPKVDQPVTFSDLSTVADGSPPITAWFWNFDDGATSTQRNPTHTFRAKRTYQVSLTATNAVSGVTKTKPVNVETEPDRAPTPNFTWTPAVGIVGQPVFFTDTSTDAPDAWSWLFNDGSPRSSVQHPSHVFPGPGEYTVELTASNSKGANTKGYPVRIEEGLKPKASFTVAPSSPLVGQAVTFRSTTTQSPKDFTWTFDDGTGGSGPAITHVFTAARSYHVVLTATNDYGQDSASADVLVTAAAEALTVQIDLLDVPPSKAGKPVRFGMRSNGTPTTFAWAFGDGGTATEAAPTHTFAKPGTYPVTLAVSDGTRTANASRTVTIVPAETPVARFHFEPPAPRVNEPVTFVDDSEGFPDSWTWDVYADGLPEGGGQRYTTTFSQSGDVLVRLTASNAAGDSLPRTQSLRVFPPADQPIVRSIKSQYGPCFFGGVTLNVPFRARIDWRGSQGGHADYRLDAGPSLRAALSGEQADFSLETGSELRGDPSKDVTKNVLAVTATSDAGFTSPPEALTLASIRVPFASTLGGFGVGKKFEPNRVTFVQTVAIPVDPIPEITFTPPSFVPLIGGKPFGLKETQIAFQNSYATDCSASSRGQGQTGFLIGGQLFVFNAHGVTDYTISPERGFLLAKTSMGLEGAGILKGEQPLLTMFPGLQAAGSVCTIPGLGWVCDLAKVTGEVKLGGGLDYVETYKPDGITLLSKEVTGHLDNSFKLGLAVGLASTVSAELFGGGVGTVVFGWPEVIQGFDVGFEAGLTIKAFVFQWDYTYSLKCRLSGGTQFSCFGRPPSLLAGAPPDALRPIPPPGKPYAERPGGPEGPPLTDVSPLASPVAVALTAGADPDRLVVLVRESPQARNPLQRTDLGYVTKKGGVWSSPKPLTEDDRGELAPRVALRRDGKAVAVWQRVRNASLSLADLQTAADLPKLWREMEIVASVYDPATERWSPPVALTDNDVHDHAPVLAATGTPSDPRVFAIWLRDPGNGLAGTSSAPAQIVARQLAAETWGPEQVLASGLTGVFDLEAASNATEVSVVYSKGRTDLALLKYANGTWSPVTSLTNDAAEDVSPRAAYGPDGTLRVLWTKGGDLVSQKTGGPLEIVRAGSSLTTLGASLALSPSGRAVAAWVDPGDGSADVRVRLLDPGAAWSADLPITRSEAVESAFTPTFLSDDRLSLIGLETNLTMTTVDRGLEGGETLHLTNVPAPGRVDLFEASVLLGVDLAVTEPSATTEGGTTTVSAHVANLGGLTVRDAPVTLHAGRGTSGPVLSRATVAGELRPGDARDVALSFPASDDVGEVTVAVQAPGDLAASNDQAIYSFVDEPPVPCLQLSTRGGPVPLTVEVDASCSFDPDGTIASVRLDYGDGTGADAASGSHTFTRPGTYQVTATVRDDLGETRTAASTVSVGTPADPRTKVSRHRLTIPVVAKARGQLGTSFVTDLSVANTDLGSRLTVDALYLPDGRSDTFSFQTTLQPGQVASLTDVVARAFGSRNGTGWVRLDLDGPYALAASRTYNDQPDGTAGVAVPALRDTDALTPGIPRVFPQHVRAGYRVNIGFTNTSEKQAELTVAAYDGAGASLGERDYSLAPFQHYQANGEPLFQRAGRLEVRTSHAGVVAYVTTVDDLTGDAIYQTGADRRSTSAPTKVIVPSVARLKGLNDTRWRTDVRVTNPTGSATSARLTFATADARLEASLALAAGQTAAFDDAITQLFPALEGDVSGLLTVESPASVLVTSRTYNVSTQGAPGAEVQRTYGVEVPARAAAELLSPGQRAELIQLQNDERYRCNFGFASFGDAPATVNVRAYDRLGVLLGEKDYSVGGGRTTQISRIFEDLGITDPLPAARISVLVLDGGPVYAYATTVDNRTGDGIFIEARAR